MTATNSIEELIWARFTYPTHNGPWFKTFESAAIKRREELEAASVQQGIIFLGPGEEPPAGETRA